MDNPLFLLSAQWLNSESIMEGVLCYICVKKSYVLRKTWAKFKYPAEYFDELGNADGI